MVHAWLLGSTGGADGQEMTQRQYHEEIECPKRLVPCHNKCGEWVPAEELEQHMLKYCVKRPLPPLVCRTGCGLVFEGETDRQTR